MKFNSKTFCYYLRLKDKSVTKFAEAVAVTRVTVHRWLSGVRSPQAQTLERIAEALGVSTEAFCEELTAEALESLQHAAWPGNVRELRHAVESAIIRATTSELQLNDFQTSPVPRKRPAGHPNGV